MKFNSKRSIKSLAMLMLCAGLLTACNGGTNSGSGATGSIQSSISDNAKQQKVLSISNQTGGVIQNLVITESSGNVVYQSNNALNCADQTSCNVQLGQLTTSNNLLAKLYDTNNHLVSVTPLKSQLSTSNFMTVYANNTFLGFYVFKNLAVAESAAPGVLLTQLSNAFNYSATKDNSNIFPDLGSYYKSQIQNGVTDQSFYPKLISDLKQNKKLTLPANTTVSKNMKASAMILGDAQSPICDSSITGTNKFLGTILGFMGPEFGVVFSIFNDMTSMVCPSQSFDFAQAFAQVNQQLATINAQLDTLVIGQQSITTLISQYKLNDSMTEYNSYISNLNSYLNGYEGFLIGDSQHTESGPLYNNLSKLVGTGLVADTGTALPSFLSQSSLAAQVNTLSKLTSNANGGGVLPGVVAALNNLCSDPTKIQGDTIAARTNCNLIAASILAQASAIISQSQIMLLDEFNVISTDIQRTNKTDYTNPLPAGTDPLWSAAQINTFIGTISKNLTDTLINVPVSPNKYAGFIPTTDGLPQALLDTLSSQKSSLSCAESSTTASGFPGINAWYDDSDVLGTNNQYIVTSCSNNGQSQVNSKFYYNKDVISGTGSVMNVLGTLVPADTSVYSKTALNMMSISTHTGAVTPFHMWDVTLTATSLESIVVNSDPNAKSPIFINQNYTVSNPAWFYYNSTFTTPTSAYTGGWVDNTSNNEYLNQVSPGIFHTQLWVPDEHGYNFILDSNSLVYVSFLHNNNWYTFGYKQDVYKIIDGYNTAASSAIYNHDISLVCLSKTCKVSNTNGNSTDGIITWDDGTSISVGGHGQPLTNGNLWIDNRSTN